MRTGLALLCCLIALGARAQQPDTLIKKLDSLERRYDTLGKKDRNIDRSAYNAQTRLNFKTYFILLGSDFKQQFTAPFHLSGKQWGTVGKFALVAGALAFADMPLQKQALKLRNSSGTVRDVSGFVTEFGGLYEGYTLGALAAYGLIFKNDKVVTTTLLATQAYITGGAIGTLLKYLTGRQRPSYYGNDSIEAEPTFHGPFSAAGRSYKGQTISSSFPSGHTTVAFAAATVFALEYKDKPLIPIIAYSAASLIGISRITENKHWATDVLVGAALGYLSGRQVVNNYHRYAKLKAPGQRGNEVSFTVNYVDGLVMPGLVYRFR